MNSITQGKSFVKYIVTDDFIVMPKMVTWEMDPTIDEHIRVTKLGILATMPYGGKYKEPGPSSEMMKKTRSLLEKYV